MDHPAPSTPPPAAPPRRLTRSKSDRMVAGVAAGIARYFQVDPTLVRLIFVALTIGGGFGVGLYLVLWLILPEEGSEGPVKLEERAKQVGGEMKESAERIAQEVRTNQGPDRRTFLAVTLLVVGTFALLNAVSPWHWFSWNWFWPLVIITAGVALIVKR